MGASHPEVLRLIDANVNRALEGIRVCEEIARLSWESPQAMRRCRNLRHALAEALRQLPITNVQLLRSRAINSDVGRRARSSRVSSLERLLVINLQRIKESLRVLEECTRLISPRHTQLFQKLRFRSYEVEREFLLRLAPVRDNRSKGRG